MFTEEDLLSYFGQMQKIERTMHDAYRRLQDDLIHPEFKRIFGQMAREEKVHESLIEELKGLLAK